VIGSSAVAVVVLRSFLDFDARALLELAGRGANELHPARAFGDELALEWRALDPPRRAGAFLRV